jgi:hypothetical protein
VTKSSMAFKSRIENSCDFTSGLDLDSEGTLHNAHTHTS